MSKLKPLNRISRLSFIIKDDLDALSTMISNKDNGRLKDLIESLINYKKWMYERLPGKKRESLHAIIQPMQFNLKTYALASDQIKDNQLKLLDVFKSIECGQMEYVKQIIYSNEVTDDSKTILNKFLIKYQKVIDQLSRMQSTHDVRALVY